MLLFFNVFAICLTTILTATIGDQFVINITNSGPACLDSELTFNASLCLRNGEPVQDGRFLYVWFSNATSTADFEQADLDVFESGPTANLTKVFTEFQVAEAGWYSMHVRIYKLDNQLSLPLKLINWTKVAFLENQLTAGIDDFVLKSVPQLPEIARGQTDFSLTGTFNVTLNFHQSVRRRKHYPQDVFVIGYPISVTATVVDHFINPDFSFRWQVIGKTIFTEVPNIQVTFQKTDDDSIRLEAVVTVNVTDNNKTSRQVQRDSITVWKILTLKELLSNFHVKSGNGAVGEEFRAHVSCNGSSPFVISWEINDPFKSSLIYKGHVENLDHCDFYICHNFSDEGSYVLTVTLENVVDFQDTTFNVTVAPVTVGPTQHVIETSSVVPVMCTMIAIVTLLILLWSYYRVPNRALVETADFEFYSPINSLLLEITPTWLSRFRIKTKGVVQSWWHGKRNENISSFEMQSVRPNYGSCAQFPNVPH